MSVLTPFGINTLLGSPSSNILKPTLPLTPPPPPPQPPKLVRKHYSDHDSLDHHEEHHHYTKKKSRSIAMTALTLLSFLFFLHILQQCLHDQIEMTTTTTAMPTMVIQANIQAKENDQDLNREDLSSFEQIQKKSYDGVQATTPVVYEDKSSSSETSKEGSNLYRYDKIHVPVKMKMVENRPKIKKL